jgi:hypothetical protein
MVKQIARYTHSEINEEQWRTPILCKEADKFEDSTTNCALYTHHQNYGIFANTSLIISIQCVGLKLCAQYYLKFSFEIFLIMKKISRELRRGKSKKYLYFLTKCWGLFVGFN